MYGTEIKDDKVVLKTFLPFFTASSYSFHISCVVSKPLYSFILIFLKSLPTALNPSIFLLVKICFLFEGTSWFFEVKEIVIDPSTSFGIIV